MRSTRRPRDSPAPAGELSPRAKGRFGPRRSRCPRPQVATGRGCSADRARDRPRVGEVFYFGLSPTSGAVPPRSSWAVTSRRWPVPPTVRRPATTLSRWRGPERLRPATWSRAPVSRRPDGAIPRRAGVGVPAGRRRRGAAGTAVGATGTGTSAGPAVGAARARTAVAGACAAVTSTGSAVSGATIGTAGARTSVAGARTAVAGA